MPGFVALFWDEFNKIENLAFGKVFQFRFVVNGEQVSSTVLKNNVSNNPCAARFAFALAGHGQAYLLAVVANGFSFERVFL